jgi:hypothetical protein
LELESLSVVSSNSNDPLPFFPLSRTLEEGVCSEPGFLADDSVVECIEGDGDFFHTGLVTVMVEQEAAGREISALAPGFSER